MSTTNPVIDIRNIKKSFRKWGWRNWLSCNESVEKEVFSDFSWEICKGETWGIVGNNGEGKSTLLKMIAGIIQPDSGHLRVEGRVLGIIDVQSGLHPDWTGRDNILMIGVLNGFSIEEVNKKLNAIIQFSELVEYIDEKIKLYSSGMVARLAFSIVVHLDPSVLIIDETLAVGDIFFRHKCLSKIEQLQRENVTIIFVSHELNLLKQVCQKAIWIEGAQKKSQGPAGLIVDQYIANSRMANQKDTKQHLDGRYGNQKVEILNFEMTNETDERVDLFEFDQVMQIKVKIKSNISSKVNVAYQVFDSKRINICGGNFISINGHGLSVENGRSYSFRFVQRLPLKAGDYSLQVFCSSINEDGNDEIYYDVIPIAFVFKMKPRIGRELWSAVDLSTSLKWSELQNE